MHVLETHCVNPVLPQHDLQTNRHGNAGTQKEVEKVVNVAEG